MTTDITEIACDVYKTEKKENLFLYVHADAGFDKVPAELLAQFGEPEKALSFVLKPERRLAKEDPKQVIANLQNQGYHLQLPPADDRFK